MSSASIESRSELGRVEEELHCSRCRGRGTLVHSDVSAISSGDRRRLESFDDEPDAKTHLPGEHWECRDRPHTETVLMQPEQHFGRRGEPTPYESGGLPHLSPRLVASRPASFLDDNEAGHARGLVWNAEVPIGAGDVKPPLEALSR